MENYKIKKICSDKKLVIQVFCLIVLFLPIKIVEATAIYSTKTPDNIWYDYLSYSFSFLAIPILGIAVLRRKKTQAINFIRIIEISFIINILYALFNDSNIFQSCHYEMFLIMLQAEAICCIVFSFDKSGEIKQAEKFLDIYFFLAIASQLLRMVLGMSTYGRYGAIGLSVGWTGYLCAIYILYIVYCREMNLLEAIRIIVAAISLILSGQRTNLFVCILFLIPYIIKTFVIFTEKKKISKSLMRKIKYLLIFAFAIILLILFLLFLSSSGIKFAGADYIERTIEAVAALFNRNLGSVSSVSGRVASIEAGKKVLLDMPLGISNDFYDLQYRMLQENYATFPHSTLLSCLLLWTVPLTVFCAMYVIGIWKDLVKIKSPFQWVVLFIIVINIVWGGPILDVAPFFLQLYFLSLGKVLLGRKKRLKIRIKR